MKRSLPVLLIAGFVIVLSTATAEAQLDSKTPRVGRERFAVTAAEEGFVMIEQTSGRSWMLEYSADDEPVWLPITRIDDPDKAHDWRQARDAELRQAEEQEGHEEHEHHPRAESERRELDEPAAPRDRAAGERNDHERHLAADRRVVMQERLHELTARRGQRVEEHGEDDPIAWLFGREIERLESDLRDGESRPDRPAPRDGDASDRRHPPAGPDRPGIGDHCGPVTDMERRIRDRLAELAKQRADYEKRFGPAHPAIRNTDRESELLQRALTEMDPPDRRRPEGHDAPPDADRSHQPALQQLHERLRRLQADVEENLEALKTTVEEAKRRAEEAVPQIEVETTKRMRKLLDDALQGLQDQIDDVQKRLDELAAADQRPAQPTRESLAESELLPLLVEEGVLLQSHSATHPKVLEIRKKIELTRAFLKEAAEQDASESLKSELFPLLLEEEMLLQAHGPLHPKVLEVRKRIELTKKYLESLQKQETEE